MNDTVNSIPRGYSIKIFFKKIINNQGHLKVFTKNVIVKVTECLNAHENTNNTKVLS